MKISAIGFDLDDTLYDRQLIYRKALEYFEETIKPVGVPFEEFIDVFEEKSQASYRQFIRGLKSEKDYKIERIQNTYHYFSKEISKKEATVFQALYNYMTDDIQLRPYFPAIFDFLNDQDIPIFILTNGAAFSQQKKINQLQLKSEFDIQHFFISGELGYSKPDIEIFNLVSEALNIEGSEILYIGDHYQNDVTGASLAGWQTIYFDINDDSRQTTHKTVQDDKELFDWLKEELK